MNLNGDEKRIRQLFREMSREEEHRTPEFAQVIAAARSGAGRAQNETRLFTLALAVSGVAIVILIAVSFAMRHSRALPQTDPSKQVANQVAKQVAEPPPSTENEPANTLSSRVPGVSRTVIHQTIPRRVRRRRQPDDLAIRMKSLSAWQSPTASLLKAPGQEMLNSLPRLGESLQSIKSFSPDEFN